jgi:hypothetical protein
MLCYSDPPPQCLQFSKKATDGAVINLIKEKENAEILKITF